MSAEVWQRIEELRAEIENAARYSDDGTEIAELARRISRRAMDAGYEPPGCEHCNPAWHGPEAKQRLANLTRRKYEEQQRVDSAVSEELQRQADSRV